MERNLRYVELDTNGNPFHENWKSWVDGPDEETVWADLVDAATAKGHTLIRISADDPRTDRNPRLDEIQSDGRGGIMAKPAHPNALRNVRFVKNA